MASRRQEIADKIIEQQLDVLRLTAGTDRDTAKIIFRMQRELVAKLSDVDFDRVRTQRLLNQVNKVIREYYDEAWGVVEKSLDGVANVTASHTVESLAAVATIEARIPSKAFLENLSTDSMIQGANSAEWWNRQETAIKNRFADEVRQGIAQSETNQQIIERIRGRGGVGGIIKTAYRNISALVHSSVQQVANDARFKTFQDNDDLVKGVEQLSTLDGNTTDICISYSGGKWDLEGNPINGTTLPFKGGPPRHWNCRSVLIPILKTFKEIGIDLPEPKESTRASINGQLNENITFEDWLSRRSKEQQDEQLGAGRAQLWRDGTITLKQLLDLNGNPLTLEQLTEKYRL